MKFYSEVTKKLYDSQEDLTAAEKEVTDANAKKVEAAKAKKADAAKVEDAFKANNNAKRITGLVKEGGRITGYQLSDNTLVEKQQAVNMAKQGQIAGVGIAHRGDTEYLKSIPDGNENNNLGNLPSVSPNNAQ